MSKASPKLATVVAILFAASMVQAAAADVSVNGGNGSLSAGVTGGPAGTNLSVTLGGGRTATATGNSGVNGGTNATATIGGGTNIGKASVGSGGNTATVSIGNGSGPLVSGSSNGDPLSGTSSTAGAINLGGLTGIAGLPGAGGIGGGASGGTGAGAGTGGGSLGGGAVVHDPGARDPKGKTITPAKVQRVVESLSAEERRKLKLRCGSILMSPAAFDDGLVGLCRMLRGL